MTKLSTKMRLGATPGKLALVALLAVAQVVVIVRALGRRAEVVAQVAPALESPAAPREVQPAVEAHTTQHQDAALWPVASLEEAAAFDPFHKPRWSVVAAHEVTSAANDSAAALLELKEQGVSIVVLSEDGKAATIGNQQFRIGDVIDGYQVTDITTRGVEFTRLPTQ